ncbi:MAG: glycosyltransferase family 2 protein [Alphaproteobacteria bacterium]|nr:glycosyltransferase family 2 protein [Alphaproteobacteria bacterium]
MKLIVQIPCLNESDTLAETIRDIPREIDGIDKVEILVIDDGSTDNTSQLAASLGVEYIIRNRSNLGLAASFQRGVDHCLRHGADIIVNTDGDNQYCGADIANLVQPIVSGDAHVVIGDRQTDTVPHFSPFKKFLQRFGSWAVRKLSTVDVPDAVSGFRALSREAALQINVLSHFSYTIEMLIQVGRRRIAYAHVPVRTNPKTRDSRLFKSILQFLSQSGSTAARIYAMYQPLRVFWMIGLVLTIIGMLPMVRFLYFFAIGEGDGKIQSLIFGAAFLVIGFFTILLGILSDIVNYNRRLLESILFRVRSLELELRTEAAAKDDTTSPAQSVDQRPAGNKEREPVE